MSEPLNIVELGDPRLIAVSEPLQLEEFNDPKIITLCAEMITTMNTLRAVGLAAPQVGVNKRIITIGSKNARRKVEPPIPEQVLINPEFVPLTGELVEGYEGCLSAGELIVEVPRYAKISYSYLDLNGTKRTHEVDGLHARVIQHEIDHIDGVLFFERVKNFKTMGFRSILMQQYNND